MSLLYGTLSFNAMKILGDIPSCEDIIIVAAKESYAPLQEGELRRVSVVSPMVEFRRDMVQPYNPPVCGRFVAYDVVVDERCPDSKLVTKVWKEKVAIETKNKQRMERGWRMSSDRMAEIKREVCQELSVNELPRLSRASVVIDIEKKLLLISTSAIGQAVMDVTRRVTGNTCSFHDIFTAGFEATPKTKIVAFGISNEQSKPPNTNKQWIEEYLTWLAAKCMASHEAIETSDAVSVVFPGKKGKTMSVKSSMGPEDVDAFCASAMADGCLINDVSILLVGDFFADGRDEVRIKVNSSGRISGVQSGLKRGERPLRVVVGASAIVEQLIQMSDEFLAKRTSINKWIMESASVRKTISDRKVRV